MTVLAELNACNACARSKRKCGRQTPSCARCANRDWTCVYPPSRSRAGSSSRLLLSDTLRGSVSRMENELLAEAAGNTSSRTTDLILADDLMLDPAFPFMENDFVIPSSLTSMLSAPTIRAEWFLAPETWMISPKLETSAAVVDGKATIERYIAVLKSWFERWVTTGSNPFVHPRLYSANFPACVQIAYTTLASYIHRTPANTNTVLQIVEERSNDLLRESGAVLDKFSAEQWADRGEQDIGLFAQLTRLHALVVYQFIGLFDGDIRSRHVAEGHIAVQNSWTSKLFHSAAKAMSSSGVDAMHLVASLPRPSTYSQQQWSLWILSESIRRTWLVAASISCVFSALRQGWSVCPGSVMYTNRNGLWTAASATEWEKQCLRRNVAFLQRFECGKIFENAEPKDIDEFGVAMLDITFSGEILEKWKDKNSSL